MSEESNWHSSYVETVLSRAKNMYRYLCNCCGTLSMLECCSMFYLSVVVETRQTYLLECMLVDF